MRVLPIKGVNGLNALKGLSALLLGYFFLALPEKEKQNCDSFEEFFESFKLKTDEEKEKILRYSLLFVKIETLELEALVSFVFDKNGIAYSAPSIKNMDLLELIEVIVAVCMEMSRIRITLVSEDEKKKYLDSQSMCVGSS